MNSSRKVLYEALGAYIDDLSSALYLGTARGEISISNGNGKHLMTPSGKSMPLIDIFYRDGSLEFVAFWTGNGKTRACRLKAALSKTSVEYRSGRIVMEIEPHGSLNGSAEVVLLAGRGFANTIKRTISEGAGL
ncbi:hypothetical protein [Thermococcus sp.]